MGLAKNTEDTPDNMVHERTEGSDLDFLLGKAYTRGILDMWIKEMLQI